ncbi:hypothetical protein N9A89_06125 [Akkermansiaceae bacterium]|nr:hypothetical protein [Akkermansiaceae bacterium]MDA7936081.1 hypothetical protein [bacterium]MDC1205965.1 hypothetical protein [Akkermansiaceae bacterium]
MRYQSNIPNHVGLAGSSAIITACFKALMLFYDISIPPPILANLVLSIETEELRIPAGLQDRVIQAYEGLVFMDFAQEHFENEGYGSYEELDISSLPSLYLADTTSAAVATTPARSGKLSRLLKNFPARNRSTNTSMTTG